MPKRTEVTERLASFVRMVCPVARLLLTRLDTNMNILYTNASNPQLIRTIFLLGTDGNLQRQAERGKLIADTDVRLLDGAACMFTNQMGMAWISEILIDAEQAQEILILGPVFLNRYSPKKLTDDLQRLQISLQIQRMFLEEVQTIPVISLNRFYEYGSMFHYCITGKHNRISDFVYPQDQESAEEFPAERDHEVNYDLEQRMIKLIEDGNMNFHKEFDMPKLSASWDPADAGELMEQAKNLVVMNTTLASRAAIRGGMSPQAALTMRVDFLHEAGQASSLGALNEINERMVTTYIRRVHMIKIQQGRSPQIQKCCEYIATHLSEHLDIPALARLAGYSDYYFSKKFRSEVGIGVRDYIKQQKVEAAKDYLLHSSLRVNEIAEALGYENQGYFSEVFRKATGVSPLDYRARGIAKENTDNL